MKLEDYIEKSNSGDVKGAMEALVKALQEKDEESLQSFIKTQESIDSKLTDLCSLMEKLVSKPDPEQREFPEYQKVTMDCPEWYVPPIADEKQDMSWVAGITNSIRFDGEQTRKVLQQILDNLNEEDAEEELTETKPEPKTVNSAAVRSRRTTQWKRFDNYSLNNLLNPSGDNQTYFMPDSLIPNSETVRLNGGTPLLNSDYTVTGNKLFFTVPNIVGAQIEIRGQIK
jgi:hypothetical protein